MGDESNSKSVMIDEVKKNPKWLEMSYSEKIMLEEIFERRLTRPRSSLVNYSLMG